jgi:hypothetical protein
VLHGFVVGFRRGTARRRDRLFQDVGNPGIRARANGSGRPRRAGRCARRFRPACGQRGAFLDDAQRATSTALLTEPSWRAPSRLGGERVADLAAEAQPGQRLRGGGLFSAIQVGA